MVCFVMVGFSCRLSALCAVIGTKAAIKPLTTMTRRLAPISFSRSLFFICFTSVSRAEYRRRAKRRGAMVSRPRYLGRSGLRRYVASCQISRSEMPRPHRHRPGLIGLLPLAASVVSSRQSMLKLETTPGSIGRRK